MIGQVNVSVANLYGEGTYKSELVSQAILGESFEILNMQKYFTHIRLFDNYDGWISNYQWIEKNLPDEDMIRVRSLSITLYENADINSFPVRDAVIGTQLRKIEEKNDWIQIELPDGKKAWAQSEKFRNFPEQSRSSLLNLAMEYLGCPYFWGGRTPKGLDCSGLTYSVFNLLGIKIRRDSWMQHEDGKRVEVNPEKAKKGDLYFFAEGGLRITHVGIAMGAGKIIHSRGMVRINSLISSDIDYSEELLNSFVDVRSFMDHKIN